METVDKRYGKVLKGHTAPYGAFVGASAELKQAYYNHGYLRDEDMLEHALMSMPFSPSG